MASAEAEIKVITETAQQFISLYYQAVSSLSALDSFYTTSSSRYAGMEPDISINGLAGLTPAQYEAMLAAQNDPSSSSTTTTPAPTTTTTTTPELGSANGLRPPTSRVSYTVESLDAHLINPDFALGDPSPASGSGSMPVGQRASVLVQVTGRVSFGRGRDAPRQSFNEVFVLVPNWDGVGKNARKNAKRYLIMSQNFRAL